VPHVTVKTSMEGDANGPSRSDGEIPGYDVFRGLVAREGLSYHVPKLSKNNSLADHFVRVVYHHYALVTTARGRFRPSANLAARSGAAKIVRDHPRNPGDQLWRSQPMGALGRLRMEDRDMGALSPGHRTSLLASVRPLGSASQGPHDVLALTAEAVERQT
jgi:hypothetical protein